MIRAIALALTLIAIIGFSVPAQDEARALWQVANFDVTVNNPDAERALSARAVLTVRNIGRGSGATLTLRINAKAEIKSVMVGAATAGYRLQPERAGNAKRSRLRCQADCR